MRDSHVVYCGTETITPLHANVLVRPDPADVMTKGGLYVPDNAKSRTQRGTVMAVGPDCKAVTVGQRVLFTYWSAAHLDLNDVEHLLYAEKDLLGVLHGEESPAHDTR